MKAKWTISEAAFEVLKSAEGPVIPIDRNMIVDFMIKKQFGIEHEDLPIYVNAIDEISLDNLFEL